MVHIFELPIEIIVEAMLFLNVSDIISCTEVCSLMFQAYQSHACLRLMVLEYRTGFKYMERGGSSAKGVNMITTYSRILGSRYPKFEVQSTIKLGVPTEFFFEKNGVILYITVEDDIGTVFVRRLPSPLRGVTMLNWEWRLPDELCQHAQSTVPHKRLQVFIDTLNSRVVFLTASYDLGNECITLHVLDLETGRGALRSPFAHGKVLPKLLPTRQLAQSVFLRSRYLALLAEHDGNEPTLYVYDVHTGALAFTASCAIYKCTTFLNDDKLLSAVIQDGVLKYRVVDLSVSPPSMRDFSTPFGSIVNAGTSHWIPLGLNMLIGSEFGWRNSDRGLENRGAFLVADETAYARTAIILISDREARSARIAYIDAWTSFSSFDGEPEHGRAASVPWSVWSRKDPLLVRKSIPDAVYNVSSAQARSRAWIKGLSMFDMHQRRNRYLLDLGASAISKRGFEIDEGSTISNMIMREGVRLDATSSRRVVSARWAHCWTGDCVLTFKLSAHGLQNGYEGGPFDEIVVRQMSQV